MPRRENRQNKTSRLQYQTVKNNQQPHIPAKTTGNTQGGGWGIDHPCLNRR